MAKEKELKVEVGDLPKEKAVEKVKELAKTTEKPQSPPEPVLPKTYDEVKQYLFGITNNITQLKRNGVGLDIQMETMQLELLDYRLKQDEIKLVIKQDVYSDEDFKNEKQRTTALETKLSDDDKYKELETKIKEIDQGIKKSIHDKNLIKINTLHLGRLYDIYFVDLKEKTNK